MNDCHANGLGTCSLRDAITFANSNQGLDTIRFALTGDGPHTFSLVAPLPPLTDPAGALIEGYSQPGASPNANDIGTTAVIKIQVLGTGQVDGIRLHSGNNVIEGLSLTGFGGHAIVVNGNDNVIAGNFIGVHPAGGGGSNAGGILISPGSQRTRIGGTERADTNVISANSGSGIRVDGPGTASTIISGNLIGTTTTATGTLGNATWGIHLDGASDSVITGNVIAYNAAGGISVQDDTAIRNRIQRNEIFQNGGLGIDLGLPGVNANDAGDTDGGPNFLQNAPVLTGAFLSSVSGQVLVTGTMDSNALGGAVAIEIFRADANTTGPGEGRFPLYLKEGSGVGSFNFVAGPFSPAINEAAGNYISSLATSMDGTSEFSGNLPLVLNTVPVANAGANLTATVGSLVTLNGTLSTDANAKPLPLTYQWAQIGGPLAQLSGATTAQPTFSPPRGGTYSFELKVSDGLDTSTGALVTVTVGDTNVPVALPQTVSAVSGTPRSIRLTGRDVEDSLLTFKIVDPPLNGSMAGFNEVSGVAIYTATPGFSGTDTFTFTVSDGVNTSPPATITIIVAQGINITTPAPPRATQGIPYRTALEVIGGEGPYTWTANPANLPAGIDLTPGGELTGTPQQAGNYTFPVTVQDSAGMTSTRTITFVVIGANVRPFRLFAILAAND